jgi:hypothetical protein
MQLMNPYSGPLKGGTVSEGFGNSFYLKPDVGYGSIRATAGVNGGSNTSPTASVPGPVNLKWVFPDGIEVYDPLFCVG